LYYLALTKYKTYYLMHPREETALNKIKHYRELTRQTQLQLGETVGVGQGAIGHYESGRRDPDLEACRAIVAALAAAGAITEQGAAVSLDDVFPPAERDPEVGTEAA
jgi:putative transcriptional regulator